MGREYYPYTTREYNAAREKNLRKNTQQANVQSLTVFLDLAPRPCPRPRRWLLASLRPPPRGFFPL